jgi:hypothetical protein
MVSVVDSTVTTRQIFADGSVSLVSVQVPEKVPATGTSANSVSGCSSYMGTAHRVFSNCKVSYNGISFAHHFSVNYGKALRPTSKSYVSRAWGGVVDRVIRGTASNPKVAIGRMYATSSSPAYARMNYNAHFLGTLGVINPSMRISVKGSSVETANR